MRNNEDRFNSPSPEMTPQAQLSSLNYVVPTELVELPSKGLFYSPDHPLYEKEFVEIKHMTAKEEDILTSISLIEKGVVMDYLIQSLLMDKRINPKSLLPGDQSAILLNARINAYGEKYSFEYNCSSCNGKNVVDFDLSGVKNKELPANYEVDNGLVSLTLPKSNFLIKLRQLDNNAFAIMEKEQKQSNHLLPGTSTGSLTLFLLHAIDSINGEKNDRGLKFRNVIENLTSPDVRILKDVYTKCKPDVDMQIYLECRHCGNAKEETVPITAKFFWPDP